MGIDKTKKINTGVNKTPENPSKQYGGQKKSPLQSTKEKVKDKVHSILQRKK